LLLTRPGTVLCAGPHVVYTKPKAAAKHEYQIVTIARKWPIGHFPLTGAWLASPPCTT